MNVDVNSSAPNGLWYPEEGQDSRRSPAARTPFSQRSLHDDDQCGSIPMGEIARLYHDQKSSAHLLHTNLVSGTTPEAAYTSQYDGQARELRPVTFGREAPDPLLSVDWKGPRWFGLIWDALSVVVSIIFLVLGGYIAALQGRQMTPGSNRIIELTQLTTTLWPIIFSSILGNTIRMCANWKVERGISLQVLEQLMGSLTMANTVLTSLSLSSLRFLTVVLIFLWAFNPLGSQASLRAVYLKDFQEAGNGNITYYDYNISSQIDISQLGGISAAFPAMAALYAGSIYAADSGTQYSNNSGSSYSKLITKLGGASSSGIKVAADPWGNPRIPNYRATRGYDPSNPHQWLPTPWTEGVQSYSSLLGSRIQGIDPSFTGQTDFTLSSNYEEFTCSPWISVNETGTWLTNNRNLFWSFCSSSYCTNSTGILNALFADYRTFVLDITNATSIFWTDPQSEQLDNVKPTISFASLALGTVQVTTCTVRTVYVDAQVTCESVANSSTPVCGVNAVREMQQPPTPENWTLFSPRQGGITHMTRFFQLFPTMLIPSSAKQSGVSSATENYLMSPVDAIDIGALENFVNLSTVPIELFQDRLALLVNTYWQSSLHPFPMFGGDMTASRYPTELLNITSSTTTPLPPVYQLSTFWMTIYFVAAALMLLASLMTVIMRWYCVAPQILGYVGGLVRDSPYFERCGLAGHSTESGIETSLRLSKVQVRVADVKVESDVGRVAFAPVSLGGRVKSGRWYE